MPSIKTSPYQRRLKKSAAKPIPSAPPAPEETEALAAAGVPINRGNSNQQPMSDEGVAQEQDIAAKLAARGGFDRGVTSPAVRTQQTMDAIQGANPQPLPMQQDPNLESWAQGNLEGQPKAAVRQQIRDLIRQNPGLKIPGQGAMSTRPGESFDDFRTRALSSVRGLMQMLADDPTQKIIAPVHSSVKKLARAWIANGTPDDLSVDPAAMDDQGEQPGRVDQLSPTQDGKWSLDEVNPDDPTPLQPGIYLPSHGLTPSNAKTYEAANSGQEALKQIAGHTKSFDFNRLKVVAQKAAQAGHLSDDQISQAIDRSLPDATAAQDLPLNKLLAVASVSPTKRAEYAPIIQQRMKDAAQQLPPQALAQIQQHLRLIGLG